MNQNNKASNVEVVLLDNQKLELADIVSDSNKAFELFAKSQDASIAYETIETSLADNLYSYLVEHKPNYASYQAIKKHIISSVANAKNRKFETIENWLNKNVIKSVVALGYEIPKAETKSAVAMSELRKELANKDEKTLKAEKIELAKQGTRDALKRAMQLQAEIERRAKLEANKVKLSESKALTALKNSAKKWITGLNEIQIARLIDLKNQIETGVITKQ